MAQWLPFTVVIAALTVLLLVLARQSQELIQEASSEETDEQSTETDTDRVQAPIADELPEETVDKSVHSTSVDSTEENADFPQHPREETAVQPQDLELTPTALLANVGLTQGLVAVLVLVAGWYFEIPAAAFGVTGEPLSTGLPAIGLGIAFGVVLWIGNEFSTTVADAVGASYDEGVREMLAPDSPAGWAVLFGLVLPLIAVSEELLFRAALIGVPAAGFDISPWILAVFSSLAFALGHGAQGRVGIIVTGLLGFVLAAGYVVTGSLLLVIVAHYVINALEFFVHEYVGVDEIFSGFSAVTG